MAAGCWAPTVGLRPLSGECWAAIVERGGLLAGAAHPRRQKHREMPPPGASAPAFAATVVLVSIQNIQGKTRRQRVMERVLGDGLLSCIDS